MRRILVIFTGILVVSACYLAFHPIAEVRYNAGDNGSKKCYSESELDHTLPEGCEASIQPTVAQTWAQGLVGVSAAGVVVLGIMTVLRMRAKRQGTQ